MIKNKPIFNLVVNLLLLALRGCDALTPIKIEVPVAATSGATVTMECSYDLESAALYTIKWYFNEQEFYRFVPKESPPSWAYPVTNINVDLSRSGPTAVTLRAIHRGLTGNYKCEISADAPFFHTEIMTAHMTVADIPASDPVLNVVPDKVEVGKTIVADCYVPGSDPPANITWYINDIKINRSTEEIKLFPTEIETDLALNLYTPKSKVEILANRSLFQHGAMIIKCQGAVYSLWTGTAEGFVRDEPPHLAPVLGSTSSQSHEKYDVLTSSSDLTSSQTRIVLRVLFFYLIFYVR